MRPGSPPSSFRPGECITGGRCAMKGSEDPLRVMLVDDTEALRFALGRVLRLYGFDVCEAVDGRDALDHIDTFRPQLVLTDLMMPVMDGVELIRQLRNTPE